MIVILAKILKGHPQQGEAALKLSLISDFGKFSREKLIYCIRVSASPPPLIGGMPLAFVLLSSTTTPYYLGISLRFFFLIRSYLLNKTMSGFQTLSGGKRRTPIPPYSASSH